jgi:hypothetical protein
LILTCNCCGVDEALGEAVLSVVDVGEETVGIELEIPSVGTGMTDDGGNEIELEFELGGGVSSPVEAGVGFILGALPGKADADGVAVPFDTGEGILLGAIGSMPPVEFEVLGADGAVVPLDDTEGIAVGVMFSLLLEIGEGAAVPLTNVEGVPVGATVSLPPPVVLGVGTTLVPPEETDEEIAVGAFVSLPPIGEGILL